MTFDELIKDIEKSLQELTLQVGKLKELAEKKKESKAGSFLYETTAR